MTLRGLLIPASVVQAHLQSIINSAGSSPLGPAELTAINAGEDMGLLTVDSRVEGLPTGIAWTQLGELPSPSNFRTIRWERHPNFGDLLPLEEFQELTSCYAITPDDGSGVWATDNLISDQDCFDDPRPTEATHVMWFSK